MKLWKEKSGFESHESICRKIAWDLNLDYNRVKKTLNAFLSWNGLLRYLNYKYKVKIVGFGHFTLTQRGKSLGKRAERVKRINERFKKRRYHRKKLSKI